MRSHTYKTTQTISHDHLPPFTSPCHPQLQKTAMPCYQLNTQPQGHYKIGQGGYATEADCLNACKEGACCESNGTCNVRPQCQCQGAGQTFQGIGTVCSPNPCGCCTRLSASHVDPPAFVVTLTSLTIQRTGFTSVQEHVFKEIPWSTPFIVPHNIGASLVGIGRCAYGDNFFEDDCPGGQFIGKASIVIFPISSTPLSRMDMSFSIRDRVIPPEAFTGLGSDVCVGFDLQFRNLPSPCDPSQYPQTFTFVKDYGINNFRFSGSISIGLSS